MRLVIDNVSKTYRLGVRAVHKFSLELGSTLVGGRTRSRATTAIGRESCLREITDSMIRRITR